jgi:hypothetical protein
VSASLSPSPNASLSLSLSPNAALSPNADAALSPNADALEPGFQCARTHWIRGFMAFQRVQPTSTVMLMVSV